MVIDQNSLSAHTAAVSVQRPKPGAGPIKWVLLAATVGLSFALPVLGSIIGYIPSRLTNKLEDNAEHDSIAQHYSEEIGARLGKDPKQVTRDDLHEVAARDAGFSQLLQGVQEQKDSADRSSLIGAGAGAVMHGVGFIVGSVAADVGASMLFKKDEVFVLDATDAIEAKIAAGQPVSMEDVFMLRVAQNDLLAERILQETGKKYHKLDPSNKDDAQKLTKLYQSMPGLVEAAKRDAELLNTGKVKAQSLAVQTAPAQQEWAQRVGKKPAASGGFRQQVEARRAQAATTQITT